MQQQAELQGMASALGSLPASVGGAGVSPAVPVYTDIPDPANRRNVLIDDSGTDRLNVFSEAVGGAAPDMVKNMASRRMLAQMAKCTMDATYTATHRPSNPVPAWWLSCGGDALVRGQTFTRGNTGFYWEYETMRNLKYFLNCTYFPTVVWDSVAKVYASLPFACFYSGSMPNTQAVGHPPQWVPYTSKLTGAKINVDMACIADNNALLSLVAAIETAGPVPESWIWFSPAWHDGYSPAPSRIQGASFGLALAACIMGAASVFYTGFIKRIPPNMGAWRKESQDYATAFHTDDIVEDVKYVPVKVAYCLQHQYVIVIPHSSAFMTNIEAIIKKHPSYAQLIALGAKEFYTTTESDAGIPYSLRRSSILAATSVPEACQLAAYAFMTIMNPVSTNLPIAIMENEAYKEGKYLQTPDGKLEESRANAIESSAARRKLIKDQGFVGAFRQAAQNKLTTLHDTTTRLQNKRAALTRAAQANASPAAIQARAKSAEEKRKASLARLKTLKKTAPKGTKGGPRAPASSRKLSVKGAKLLDALDQETARQLHNSITELSRFRGSAPSSVAPSMMPSRSVSIAPSPSPQREVSEVRVDEVQDIPQSLPGEREWFSSEGQTLALGGTSPPPLQLTAPPPVKKRQVPIIQSNVKSSGFGTKGHHASAMADKLERERKAARRQEALEKAAVPVSDSAERKERYRDQRMFEALKSLYQDDSGHDELISSMPRKNLEAARKMILEVLQAYGSLPVGEFARTVLREEHPSGWVNKMNSLLLKNEDIARIITDEATAIDDQKNK